MGEQVVVDRVDTVRTQRDLHVEMLNLLKDNAALRTSVACKQHMSCVLLALRHACLEENLLVSRP